MKARMMFMVRPATPVIALTLVLLARPASADMTVYELNRTENH